MGTWGPASWDNDSAADWFARMFEETKLAEFVERTLNLDPQDEPEEIRAAAYILVALGQTYTWPIEDLDRHLVLAVAKLEAIKSLYEKNDPHYDTTINQEIAKLKSEMTPA